MNPAVLTFAAAAMDADAPGAPELLVFDIETGPLDKSTLASQLPPFDPAEVKVGNLKDPALISAKIEAARINHEAQFYAKAALSPATGQIVAIGVRSVTAEKTDEQLCFSDGDEAKLLSWFFDLFRESTSKTRRVFIGHNIYDFDLPFIVNRARILGVKIPHGIFEFNRGRVYWNNRFIDTRALWLLGRKPTETQSSLDHCATAFGLGGKSGNGADFAALAVTDRAAAEAYLRQDLELTERLALRLA